MADRVIQQADLKGIERDLDIIYNRLETLDTGIGNVNSNVKVVYDEVEKLAQDFYDFVSLQTRANRLGQAETRLVKIRQELNKKFGHYDSVRRATTGILQADDLGIVKRDTISNASEELMINTPGYWLAPCLVALAAWINDDRELAQKALREGIKRNDEKTSLFFAIICMRAERKDACLLWTQRYLANQDEENLDRNAVIVLDAFAGGLLGADTGGVVSRQIDEWLNHLEDKPGFTEQQIEQWSEAINLKRKPVEASAYPYLRKYSKTWPEIEYVLEGAYLHAEMLDYLTKIFEQKSSTAEVKEQLDEVLNNLVSNFDDEELPLRKKEKFEQLIVDFDGDENRASQNMQAEETVFETHKDFTQLLTDAAMKPDSSHASVSTQKFAFALSRDWVTDAYKDVVAKNRMKVPHEIEINIDTFNDKTKDGEDEKELIERYDALIEKEKADAIAKCEEGGNGTGSMIIGGIVAGVGLLFLAMGSAMMLLAIIAFIFGGVLFFKGISQKNVIEDNKKRIAEQYDTKKQKGEQIVRAVLAEVVDFRVEFQEKDSESQQVIDYLEQLTPDHYIKKLSGARRRITL